MTATSHAIIGAAIAIKIPNPFISIPLAFLSHFICDKIPHWDVMTKKADKTKTQIFIYAAMDGILSLFLVTALFFVSFQNSDPVNIFLSAFVAQLPDWLEIPYTIFHKDVWISKIDYQFQKWIHDVGFNSRLVAPWGIVSQFGVVLAFVIWSLS